MSYKKQSVTNEYIEAFRFLAIANRKAELISFLWSQLKSDEWKEIAKTKIFRYKIC